MPRPKESSRAVNILRKPSHPPAPPHPTPVGSPTSSYQPPSFMQTIKEGFGFGVGSSIARNLFESNKTVIHKHEPAQLAQPAQANPEYTQCMKESSNNPDACKHLLD